MVIRIPDVVRRLMEECKWKFIDNPLGTWKRIINQIDQTRFHKSITFSALFRALKEYLVDNKIIDETYFPRDPTILKSIGGGTVQPSHGDSNTAGEVYVFGVFNLYSTHVKRFLFFDIGHWKRDGIYPLSISVIMSLTNGGGHLVVDGDHKITFAEDEMIIFSGDLLHAGGKYDKTHYRFLS